MNVFLLSPNIRASCAELARIDPRRAMCQLKECCQILASVEWAITGSCTMIKKDGTPYGRSHPHHPCVVQATKSYRQFELVSAVAFWLSDIFSAHACAASYSAWDTLLHDDRWSKDSRLVIVRRNHTHVYVDSLRRYAALMRPYFLAKLEQGPIHHCASAADIDFSDEQAEQSFQK